MACIASFFPDYGSGDCLLDLLPFCSTDHLAELADLDLYRPNEEISFKLLCDIILSRNSTDEIAFPLLCKLPEILSDADIEWDFSPLISVLKQSLSLLESHNCIDLITFIHDRLLLIDFSDAIEYWEFLLLSIFASSSSGDTQRLEVYAPLLPGVLLNLLTSFTTPPDYAPSGESDLSALYEQQRTMLLILLKIDTNAVLEGISAAFERAQEAFDADMFMSLVWSVGGLARSVDESFAVRSLEFVAAVHNEFKTLDISVAGCFIYLGMHYIKAHKIGPDNAQAIGELSYGHLGSAEIQHLCVQYLATAAREMPEVICGFVNPEEILLSDGMFQSEDFASLAEIVARCAIQKSGLSTVVAILAHKQMQMQGVHASVQSTSVRADCVAGIMAQILPLLKEATNFKQYFDVRVRRSRSSESFLKGRKLSSRLCHPLVWAREDPNARSMKSISQCSI
jgi:hypothetical protein